jgi:environmental stress-induced protein Ves
MTNDTGKRRNILKISVIKDKDVITSEWAGGESRQYYIYPPGSDYGLRNFMFRVSMAASYSDDKAKYSNLENFTRYLIMLEGTAHVFHKDHYDVVMNPYNEIDVFDGGWESYATGKVIDFNLMTSKNCKGSMSVVNKSCVIEIESGKNINHNWLMFFCGNGSASFDLSSGENINLLKNDLVVFENIESTLKINMHSGNAKLIKMFIHC